MTGRSQRSSSAFSIFIALETWLTPIQGSIVDTLGIRRGPKLMVAFGGVMVALGWIVNANAQSLGMLYLGAVLAGTGGGAIYATCVGQAVKWFPDRRGLAVGLTAAGCAGAALTVVPIRAVIASGGYEAAFFWFGLIQGGESFSFWLGSCVRRIPGELSGAAAPKVVQDRAELLALAAEHAGVLDPLHHVHHGVGIGPDGDRADRAPIAKDFGIGNTVVFWGAATLGAALIIDNICNGRHDRYSAGFPTTSAANTPWRSLSVSAVLPIGCWAALGRRRGRSCCLRR